MCGMIFVVLLWADSDMGSKRGVSVDPARQRERKNKNTMYVIVEIQGQQFKVENGKNCLSTIWEQSMELFSNLTKYCSSIKMEL